MCKWSVTHCWKALEESYNFASYLIPIRDLSRELRAPKVVGFQTGTVSGLFLGNPENKKSFGCGCGTATQRILYGGRWCFPQVWAVVNLVSLCCPWLVPTPIVFPKVN